MIVQPYDLTIAPVVLAAASGRVYTFIPNMQAQYVAREDLASLQAQRPDIVEARVAVSTNGTGSKA